MNEEKKLEDTVSAFLNYGYKDKKTSQNKEFCLIHIIIHIQHLIEQK